MCLNKSKLYIASRYMYGTLADKLNVVNPGPLPFKNIDINYVLQQEDHCFSDVLF